MKNLTEMIDAVMGIIGYTHGVRLVSTPAPNSAARARSGLDERASDRPPAGSICAHRSASRKWVEFMYVVG